FIILSYQIYDTKIKPKFPIETLYTLSQISEIFISAYYYTLKTFIGLIIPIVILYIIIKTNVYKRLEKFDILNNIIQENMTIIILIGVIMYLILIIYSFLPKYTINISEREHLRKHLIGRPKDSVEKINNIMTVDKINDTIKNYQSLY
ncbi:MAG: hypothetical protein LBQ34_05070, partial [Alphaproteobacteria bacterium]|nr:hypothetical protein [Alphaproteobacteria bacterium]